MQQITRTFFSKIYKYIDLAAIFVIFLSTSLRLFYALTRDLFPSGPDGPWYIQVMSDFAKYGAFSTKISFLPFYPSGYPFVFSIFPRVSDSSWIVFAQATQILLLGFAITIWHYWISSIFNKTVGLISVLMVSLSTSWIVFPGEAMYESFLIPLLMLYYSFIYIKLKKSEIKYHSYIFVGLAAGFILSVHPRTLPLLLLPVVLVAGRKLNFVNSLYSVFSFLIFPLFFAYRNYLGTGKFTLFSASYSSYNYGHQAPLHGSSVYDLITNAISHPVLFIHDTIINSLYFFSPFSGPLRRGFWFHNISIYTFLERAGYRDIAIGISFIFSFIAFILLIIGLRVLYRNSRELFIFFFGGVFIIYLTDALIYGENRHRLVAYIFTLPVYANLFWFKINERYFAKT